MNKMSHIVRKVDLYNRIDFSVVIDFKTNRKSNKFWKYGYITKKLMSIKVKHLNEKNINVFQRKVIIWLVFVNLMMCWFVNRW